MNRKWIAFLLAAGSLFAGETPVSIGAPPPPRVVKSRPKKPGLGFVWISGFWYPGGDRYFWHDGYWGRPPSRGAVWVAPYYDGSYHVGYWRYRDSRLASFHQR